MKIKPITTLDELRKLAEDWHCLTRGTPFRSLAWLGSWWRHFGDDGQLLTLAVLDDGDKLVGLAPLFIEHCRGAGRVLRLLGSGSVCSDYMSLLSTIEHEGQVVTALADWFTSAAAESANGNGWDLLELTGVSASDKLVGKFEKAMARRGATTHRRQGLNCWRIELPETWKEYVESLSKSHRKQVRRAERRLFDSGRAQWFTATSKDELDRGMRILIDLHTRRRKSLGQDGCFSCPRFSKFLSEAAERLFEERCLQLHWIELEGRPIAAEFHLLGGGITYAYQAGVDPDSLSQEPGRMINIAVLKNAIDEGQRAFDFLRGDEPYKAHWRAKPKPTLELRIAPSRTTSQLRHRMWLAGHQMKHWVKGAIQTAGM